MNSKIIQISIAPAVWKADENHPYLTNPVLFALCEDGTVWTREWYGPHSSGAWMPLT